jgi:hypothetical protein
MLCQLCDGRGSYTEITSFGSITFKPCPCKSIRSVQAVEPDTKENEKVS